MIRTGAFTPSGQLVRAIGLLAFPLLCDPSVGSAAAEGVVIGIVEVFDGPSTDYGLRRNNAELGLHICDEIQPGDKIVFRRKDGRVRIRMISGEVRTITSLAQEEPITAPKGEAASISGNLLVNLREMLTPWHDFVEFNFSVRGAGRSQPVGELLDLPLVPVTGAAIDAGAPSFALVWNGGSPPFTVSVHASGNQDAVLNAAGIEARALQERPLTITEGIYTLRLSDSAGRRIERQLTVVPPKDLPRPPPDAGFAGIPPAWQVTARAGWLAQQDNGRWLLQAYLDTLPVAADFEPARILADLLATGGPVEKR
jgi:hypothetical protein